jgi:hypothetical protein
VTVVQQTFCKIRKHVKFKLIQTHYFNILGTEGTELDIFMTRLQEQDVNQRNYTKCSSNELEQPTFS